VPYLFEGWCLSECKRGYTPINGECVKCESPCNECEHGQVTSCLSCNNDGERQFLYGRTCLSSCPVNTTLLFEEKVCEGCEGEGCAFCANYDPSICLKCAPGLSMLNGTCKNECPFQYLKSADGSTCERRTYELDSTFVVFPILGTSLFFVLITYASWWLTAHRSLINSSLIAFFGPIEMAACFYQFLYST